MIQLRKLISTDKDLLIAYLNDPVQTHFLSARIPQPYTAEAADWWINTGSHIGIVYAIEYQGVLAGTISALPGEFEKQKTAEIGYWVAGPYWGQGIATEALQKFTHLLFESTDLTRLYASVMEGNLASAKVLQKSGYKLEAVLQKAIYKNGLVFNELHYSRGRDA
jgi:RimJ/RimL family protein N-acetyltransferase